MTSRISLRPGWECDNEIQPVHLLETCRAWIRRYVVASDDQATIMVA